MDKEDLTQDHRFIAFVAGFASSNEGYNGECMFDHLAQGRFGEWLESEGAPLRAYVEFCAEQPEFVRLYLGYLASHD